MVARQLAEARKPKSCQREVLSLQAHVELLVMGLILVNISVPGTEAGCQ